MHPLRRLAHRFHIDIHRFNPSHSPEARIGAMLAAHRVNLVFDVGANSGQYAKMLRHVGYRGRIVSFEPLPEPLRQLRVASNNDEQWEVAEPVALGAGFGAMEMNVAGNSVSSSLLPMLDSHAKSAPNSTYVARETVKVVPLDGVSSCYMGENTRAFLKIDVQGFEDRVLEGAPETLKMLTGIQIEMSLVPLYQAQQLFPEMYDRIIALGFEPWAFLPGFTINTGQMLQCDGVFFRR